MQKRASSVVIKQAQGGKQEMRSPSDWVSATMRRRQIAMLVGHDNRRLQRPWRIAWVMLRVVHRQGKKLARSGSCPRPKHQRRTHQRCQTQRTRCRLHHDHRRVRLHQPCQLSQIQGQLHYHHKTATLRSQHPSQSTRQVIPLEMLNCIYFICLPAKTLCFVWAATTRSCSITSPRLAALGA